jgi:hypothetical protein
MKSKIITKLALALIMLSGTAHAYSYDTVTDVNGVVQTIDYDNLSPAVESCSQDLYTQLGVRSSTSDRACFIRNDWMFRQCLVRVTKKMNNSNFQDEALSTASSICQYLPLNGGFEPEKVLGIFTSCSLILGDYLGAKNSAITGRYCGRAKSYDFALCTVTLAKNGVNNGNLFENVCNSATAREVSQCVFDKNLGRVDRLGNNRNNNGYEALNVCREKYDPAVRRQTDLQRIAAENKRRENQINSREENERRVHQEVLTAEAQSQEKLRAQRQAEEERRKEEEMFKKFNNDNGKVDEKKKENTQSTEVKKPQPPKVEAKPQPAPVTSSAPAPAPVSPPPSSESGDGGVIVDLPNF